MIWCCLQYVGRLSTSFFLVRRRRRSFLREMLQYRYWYSMIVVHYSLARTAAVNPATNFEKNAGNKRNLMIFIFRIPRVSSASNSIGVVLFSFHFSCFALGRSSQE